MGLKGIWLADLVGMIVQTIIFLLYIKHSNWTEITRKTVARLDQEKKDLQICEDIRRLNMLTTRRESLILETGLEAIDEEESNH